jgi:hypothetical protein
MYQLTDRSMIDKSLNHTINQSLTQSMLNQSMLDDQASKQASDRSNESFKQTKVGESVEGGEPRLKQLTNYFKQRNAQLYQPNKPNKWCIAPESVNQSITRCLLNQSTSHSEESIKQAIIHSGETVKRSASCLNPTSLTYS